MNIKEVKSLLVRRIEMIDDPDLLQAITNLIDQGVKTEVDLLQADGDDHDLALGEALAVIKRDFLKKSTDEKEQQH